MESIVPSVSSLFFVLFFVCFVFVCGVWRPRGVLFWCVCTQRDVLGFASVGA